MSGPHLWPVRVYFEDTDAGGVAYHARYLHWAERARTEALRAMGLPHQEMIARHGVFLVVRRLEVEYFKPALLDESVVVETHIRRVTGVQVLLRQIVRREAGEVLASSRPSITAFTTQSACRKRPQSDKSWAACPSA